MNDHKNGAPVDQRIATYTDLPAVKIADKVEEARALCKILETVEIPDQQRADEYGALLKQVHTEIKDLDTLRLEVGKPAREAQKDINAFFKPAIKGYTKAKDQIKGLLETYAAKVAAENQAAFEAAAQASEADAPQALARVVSEAPAAGTSTRNELKIEVVDLDKVPREFLCVDYSALKAHAKNGGDAPDGVTFTWSQKIVVGR